MNVLAAACCFSFPLFADPPTTQPSEKLIDSKTWGQYTIRVYSAPDIRDESFTFSSHEGWFEIFRDNHLVYEQAGGDFFIGGLYEKRKKHTLIPPGRDITGDGRPNLVMAEYSGGAHCCLDVHVLELGKDKKWRLLATISPRDADLSDFQDLDGDANLEFVTADYSYAYLGGSFVSVRMPEMILRYRDGDYHLAYDLMARPEPKPTELREWAHEIRDAAGWKTTEVRNGNIQFRKGKNPASDDYAFAGLLTPNRDQTPYPVLWESMFALVYTGHLDLLDKFLDMAWPKDVLGKQAFLKDFRKRLKESPYWADIVAWPKKLRPHKLHRANPAR